jgi:endonuclease/exonuclease/phosphatase family metal-dependent hydrolase
MPAIEYTGPDFAYNLDNECDAIKGHQDHRGIPRKRNDNLLLASWNLCNLGDENQKRRLDDLKIMAEVMSPFDIIAVQEIKDNYQPFKDVVGLMGFDFDYIVTDRAGNDERLGFIFDKTRIDRLQLVGELVILKNERRSVTVTYDDQPTEAKFTGFNRNPYISAFKSGHFIFTCVNVHILFGSGKSGYLRRIAEVYNLATWAHKRVTARTEYTFDHDIILIGDFNIPKANTSDRVGRQLLTYGMQLTGYGSQTGTNLAGTDHYDQIAFHPDHTNNKFSGNSGVFDFDKVIFADIWNSSQAHFIGFTKFHISDHRLLWSEWHNYIT